MSMFARPKSASIASTRAPRAPSATDKLTAMLVFPTPPLPDVTAMTVGAIVLVPERMGITEPFEGAACMAGLSAAEGVGVALAVDKVSRMGFMLGRLPGEGRG